MFEGPVSCAREAISGCSRDLYRVPMRLSLLHDRPTSGIVRLSLDARETFLGCREATFGCPRDMLQFGIFSNIVMLPQVA